MAWEHTWFSQGLSLYGYGDSLLTKCQLLLLVIPPERHIQFLCAGSSPPMSVRHLLGPGEWHQVPPSFISIEKLELHTDWATKASTGRLSSPPSCLHARRAVSPPPTPAEGDFPVAFQSPLKDFSKSSPKNTPAGECGQRSKLYFNAHEQTLEIVF